MTRKDLFIVLFKIMNFVEESLVDSINYIDETEGCVDELKEFLRQNYPQFATAIFEVDEEVMGQIENCDAVEILDRFEVCTGVDFISPYILADYLINVRPELVNKYYDMWVYDLQTIMDQDNEGLPMEERRFFEPGYGEAEFDDFEEEYKGNHK